MRFRLISVSWGQKRDENKQVLLLSAEEMPLVEQVLVWGFYDFNRI